MVLMTIIAKMHVKALPTRSETIGHPAPPPSDDSPSLGGGAIWAIEVSWASTMFRGLLQCQHIKHWIRNNGKGPNCWKIRYFSCKF